MRIRKVTFHRIKNLGNYENEKMETEIELDIGDDPIRAIAEAKFVTKNALGISTSRVQCLQEAQRAFEDEPLEVVTGPTVGIE